MVACSGSDCIRSSRRDYPRQDDEEGDSVPHQ